jgi:hypothetical protein
MGSDNITIDGQSSTFNTDGQTYSVNINGVVGYPGLFQNGTSSTNGKNNIIIQNQVLLSYHYHSD